MIFLICGQLTRHPLIELFHLSNFLQMLNDTRIADIEFFVTYLVAVRGSASMILSVVCRHFRWSAVVLIFKALISFAKLLEPYCTVRSFAVSGSNVLLMFRVVSTALQPILNSNKEIAQIGFLSNIVSIV